MFKRRTDISKDEVIKMVCDLNGMPYIPPEKRQPVNYIEVLDDDGEPFIITKDGYVINKYANGKHQPNFNSYKKRIFKKKKNKTIVARLLKNPKIKINARG